jgi:hypothetical protein
VAYPSAYGDRDAYKKFLRIAYPLPTTPTGWCKLWHRLDRTFSTAVGSPLHHDARCVLCTLRAEGKLS